VCPRDDITEAGPCPGGASSAKQGEQSNQRTDGSSTAKVRSYI
jgi:hypothetical protein